MFFFFCGNFSKAMIKYEARSTNWYVLTYYSHTLIPKKEGWRERSDRRGGCASRQGCHDGRGEAGSAIATATLGICRRSTAIISIPRRQVANAKPELFSFLWQFCEGRVSACGADGAFG